jgi:(R,R)-butanediol dehydrogenase/meso-butanediol dehydrogenase/diacetyl reductase
MSAVATMRAARYYGARDVRIEDIPVPTPPPGHLLLRIHATGVCGTDAHEYSSGPHLFPSVDRPHPVTGRTAPFTPGHELAGHVEAIGEGVTGFRIGELVASGAGSGCLNCWQCARGRTNLCSAYSSIGLNLDGGLAQYCAVPANICGSAERFGLTGDTAALSQPMSIAVHSMRQGRLNPDESALIIGCGGIGAFLTFVCSQVARDVTVIDVDPGRIDLARSLGAARGVLSSESTRSDVLDVAPEISVIYEVSGSAAGLQAALDILPRGGRLVTVSLQKEPSLIDLRRLALDEFEIIGTNAHAFGRDFADAMAFLARREAPWDDIAPVALSLDELLVEGLEPLASGRSTRIKTLIDPWAEGTRATVM